MAVSFVQRRFMSNALQKWAYNLSGFNKYGLWRDDILHENEDVKEALKRLPQNKLDERNFRILRATQLSLTHSILPKEQWTKLEEDKLYLTPIVEQVIKERKEREEWNKLY
ncbi:cytochrome b-c1 complex subunit 7-like [Diorhabda sublineata]|uniref:cytochrome b-c1 complex subunit 7-like n=1 Tax=Diorhabda sublineata TaxID=1163346 RepID=UPI0024E0FD4E|nr:cytochrome b-c1 complex subunit 7-like [Diorhabda sublineata]